MFYAVWYSSLGGLEKKRSDVSLQIILFSEFSTKIKKELNIFAITVKRKKINKYS